MLSMPQIEYSRNHTHVGTQVWLPEVTWQSLCGAVLSAHAAANMMRVAALTSTASFERDMFIGTPQC